MYTGSPSTMQRLCANSDRCVNWSCWLGACMTYTYHSGIENYNSAILFPDSFGEGKHPSTLNEFHELIDCALLKFKRGSSPSAKTLANVLGHGQVSVTNFYNHWTSIIDWYYMAYALDLVASHQVPVNSTNSMLNMVRSKQSVVKGLAIVVKNRLLGGVWQSDPLVDTDELVRTLWWYKKSGWAIEDVLGK